MGVRTGRPVYEQPPGLFTQHTDRFIVDDNSMDSDTVAESDMSFKIQIILAHGEWSSAKDIGPILKRCNTRQRQTFCDMENVYVFYIDCIHGEECSDNLHSIKNTGKDLTMKQMFDISEELISEQSDEIYGVNSINWGDSSWKHSSLIGDEEVISLLHTKVYIFSDSVLCFGKVNENSQSNTVWEDKLTRFKSLPEYRALDTIDGEPMEFEWNIFPGLTTLQLCHKVQELLSRFSVTPEIFTRRIIFMSVFNDISWGSKDNKTECESNAQLVSLYAKRFPAGHLSFLGAGSEKKWYSIREDSPQGEWDRITEKMMVTLAESGDPVFRATSPLSRGQLKSKGGGKLSIHYCADLETITTAFRTITSVNKSAQSLRSSCRYV